MNSLRVGGPLSWDSYRKEMAPGKRKVVREKALLSPLCWITWPTYRAVYKRLARGRPTYKNAPLPRFRRPLFSPRFARSVTCMNMESITGSLSPLGLNTSHIQDTLVCMLVPLLGNNLSCVTQKLVVIGGTIETARRASMFAWNRFVDCLYLLWK